jgi:hypothetical protein
MGRTFHRLWLGALVIGLAAASAAQAAPEEIQVYMDEMNRPGEVGLDLHNNYVFEGRSTPAYAGEQTPEHVYRLTPEFSYGLTPNLELGGYVLSTADGHGSYRIDGEKLRLKFIAPKTEGQNWWWGANFEIGKVQHNLDINPWNAELKAIYGIKRGRWTVAANTNIDWAVSGPAKGGATVEQDFKVSYAVREKLAFGIETYDELGELSHLGGPADRLSHVVYATLDTTLGRWDLNLGLGRGLTVGSEDHWVLKAIIGVPLQRP